VANCTLIIDGQAVKSGSAVKVNTTQEFTATISNGAYNWSVNCTDYAGHTNASEVWNFILSYSAPSPSSNPPSGSSYTGSTGSVTTAIREIVNLGDIRASTRNTAKFTNSKLIITEVFIRPAVDASHIVIIGEKLQQKPENISQPDSGIVYAYLEIKALNIKDGNISDASIAFRVNRSWVEENNINITRVTMWRYGPQGWENLTTLLDNATELSYRAITSGFSHFTITGRAEETLSARPCTENGICEEGENETNCPADCKPQQPEQICIPLTVRCNENAVEQCNEAGSGWKTVEICKYGCQNNTCILAQDRQTVWFVYATALIAALAIVAAILFRVMRRRRLSRNIGESVLATLN